MSENVKLSVDEQIMDLKEKGITFNIVSEDEAKKFLRYNTYYFKIKSYARNFVKATGGPNKGKYYNVDFKHLMELSKLDAYLRKVILSMCLDIEHVLRVRLLYDISQNEEEDGFNIVRLYLKSHSEVRVDLSNGLDKSATSDLAKAILEKDANDVPVPIWKLIETLSFGRFIELYSLYYQTYGGENYSNYLGSLKFLRNSAAHNACLLNRIKEPYNLVRKNEAITARLGAIPGYSESYKQKMKNPVVHDFIVLLFVYFDLLNTKSNRNMRAHGLDDLENLFDKVFLREKQLFEKNDSLVYTYKFVRQMIAYLKNQRNNPIGLSRSNSLTIQNRQTHASRKIRSKR